MFVLGLNPTHFICEKPLRGSLKGQDLMHAMESRKLSNAPWFPAFLILNWQWGKNTKIFSHACSSSQPSSSRCSYVVLVPVGVVWV